MSQHDEHCDDQDKNIYIKKEVEGHSRSLLFAPDVSQKTRKSTRLRLYARPERQECLRQINHPLVLLYEVHVASCMYKVIVAAALIPGAPSIYRSHDFQLARMYTHCIILYTVSYIRQQYICTVCIHIHFFMQVHCILNSNAPNTHMAAGCVIQSFRCIKAETTSKQGDIIDFIFSELHLESLWHCQLATASSGLKYVDICIKYI